MQLGDLIARDVQQARNGVRGTLQRTVSITRNKGNG